MHADLDTLVIALYVTIDDLLGPRHGPGRRPSSATPSWSVWPSPRCCSGSGTERRWLRFAGQRLGHLFPYLPTASAYNRRLRRAAAAGRLGHPGPGRPHAELVATSCGWSTPPRCRARPRGRRSSARRWPAIAGYGYCKSHHRYFWGFRLYVLAAPDGLPVAWCLATPKLGEREVVAAMLDHERRRLRPGLVILADKGFAGREFEQLVAGYGGRLLRPDRARRAARHGSLGRWRQWIESTFQTLKGQLGLERHGGRTLAGVWVRVAQRLLALAAAIWWNWEIGAPDKRSLVAYDH